MFQLFEKELQNSKSITPSGRLIYFVDGGMLLHKVVWQPASTYTDIYAAYEKYVCTHFGRGTHIIFDGYSDRMSTKGHEQTRRTKSSPCPEILFEDNMTLNIAQTRFLSNPKNKSRLISRLSKFLL